MYLFVNLVPSLLHNSLLNSKFSAVSFLFYLLWESLWRLASNLSTLFLLSLLKFSKSLPCDNCSIYLFGYYKASQLWSSLKARNHYEYYLSSVVNSVMHYLAHSVSSFSFAEATCSSRLLAPVFSPNSLRAACVTQHKSILLIKWKRSKILGINLIS